MAVCLNSLLINQGAITDCINWVASRISTAPTPNPNVLPHPTFPPPATLLSPPHQMPAGGQRPVVPQPLGGDPAATATVTNAAPTHVDQTITPTADDGPDNTTITKTSGCPPRPMGSRFTAMKVAKTAAKAASKEAAAIAAQAPIEQHNRFSILAQNEPEDLEDPEDPGVPWTEVTPKRRAQELFDGRLDDICLEHVRALFRGFPRRGGNSEE